MGLHSTACNQPGNDQSGTMEEVTSIESEEPNILEMVPGLQ